VRPLPAEGLGIFAVLEAEKVHRRLPSVAKRRPILWLVQAEDPVVAGLMWGIVLAGAIIFAISIADDSKGTRDVGLAALGGIVLLLTAYFTARTLQINGRRAFNEQLMKTAELLEENNPVRRAAASEVLRRMEEKARKRSDREAIQAVLDAADVSQP